MNGRNPLGSEKRVAGGFTNGMGGSPEGVVHRKGYVVACIMSDSDYQLSLGAGEGQKVLRWRLDV